MKVFLIPLTVIILLAVGVVYLVKFSPYQRRGMVWTQDLNPGESIKDYRFYLETSDSLRMIPLDTICNPLVPQFPRFECRTTLPSGLDPFLDMTLVVNNGIGQARMKFNLAGTALLPAQPANQKKIPNPIKDGKVV